MSSFYGWKITTLEITPKDVIESFDEVAFSQDEPFPELQQYQNIYL